MAPPRANRPATTGARAAQSGIERGRRPITPLWVITAFVSLTETVTGIAATQASSGGVRIALTAFVIGFPVFVAAAFFLVLWDRPHHFYPPTEFGRGADVSVYVEAMRRRSASEGRSYAQIQDAVRAAVSSPDILDRLKSAVGAPVETGDIRQVLDRIAAAAFQNVEQQWITVDTSPLLGREGEVHRIPFDPRLTVTEFLDDVWLSVSGAVPAHSHGRSWALRDRKTGNLIQEAGPTWALLHGRDEDDRPLTNIGLRPGMRLQTVRLEERSS